MRKSNILPLHCGNRSIEDRVVKERKNKNSTDTQKVNVVYDATEDRCRLCIFLFQFHGVFLLCNLFFNLQTLYIWMTKINTDMSAFHYLHIFSLEMLAEKRK